MRPQTGIVTPDRAGLNRGQFLRHSKNGLLRRGFSANRSSRTVGLLLIDKKWLMSGEEPLQQKATILVVDDEFMCSYALCLMLSNLGISTDSVNNGGEAIAKIL